MRFEIVDRNELWLDKYNLAKIYYKHHGNLEMPTSFKTINGYDYDENGVALGRWVTTQRIAYKGKGSSKITEEQINLLEEIGMRFENIDRNEAWLDKYNLAKVYYEHYGNLEIPRTFKTINGYEYDENGIALGTWLNHQRRAYKGKGSSKITEDQINLLEEIGMRFENIDAMKLWMDKYNLAKIYYEHYGNLEIPQTFKTINGYEHDENGVALGKWLSAQRQAYKGKGSYKITEDQIKLLEEIGMRFEIVDKKELWLEKYNLAKIYYEHHGNLEIPQTFKTVNGYEYDENGITLGVWINNQRNAYKVKGTNKITEDQIKLLEEIGMKWFSETVDNNLQQELITDENTKSKKEEIMNRLTSYLSSIDNEISDKDIINQGFLNNLESTQRKK